MHLEWQCLVRSHLSFDFYHKENVKNEFVFVKQHGMRHVGHRMDFFSFG